MKDEKCRCGALDLLGKVCGYCATKIIRLQPPGPTTAMPPPVPTTPPARPTPILRGWECPKCLAVMAPTMPCCMNCTGIKK